MKVWSILAWLATVLPLAVWLGLAASALASRWRQARPAGRAALAGLWLLGAGFLLARPHDDSFTGLDNMTYRQMAQAFVDGRGFHDVDAVLAEVPEELRQNFMLHRGPRGRPTRDRAFQLGGWRQVQTQPFFMPVLPLAAAAPAPLLAPERFVPLAGALWLALMLAAGFVAGGGWGLFGTAVLVMGTAWPAWFLRGFHAEGVGALLVAGPVAAAAIRPLRGGVAALAGFSLGFAVSYHPTLVVLSVPIAVMIMLEHRDIRDFAAVLAGGLAGIFPFWALTRWVCQPYGDWTRWSVLWKLVTRIPEHRALAVAAGLLATGSVVALWAGFRPGIRARLRTLDQRMQPWGWLALILLPAAVAGGLALGNAHAMGTGATAVWSGIRWPFALWFLAGAGWTVRPARPVRERFWLAALAWGALLFLYIQGVETPVGLWSQRRFLPVVLVGTALLAAPVGAGLAGLPRNAWRGLVVVFALAAGMANLVRWPVAFWIINERGATEWTRTVAEKIGTERRVVFDYYPHSVPYAVGLKHRVLGLGETAREYWPAVASWLAGAARDEETWLATSWSPATLDEGMRLDPGESVTGHFPVVKTKAFFPAEPGVRTVENRFLRAVPLAAGEIAPQDKILDGSPVGLRGPWGPVRRGASWTRQGSGIVGPVPEAGGTAVFEADSAWAPPTDDWRSQVMYVEPPWGGRPLRLEVPAGDQRILGRLVRPVEDGERAATGTYTLRVARPYDPATTGLRGYAADLGVPLRRVIIRIEPAPASVPD